MNGFSTETLIKKVPRAVEFSISKTPVIKDIYWKIAPTFYKKKLKQRVRRQYDYQAPLNPVKILWIDPSRVSRMSGRNSATNERWRDIGTIRGGSWDIQPPSKDRRKQRQHLEGVFTAESIEQTIVYQSFDRHFNKDKPWEETELVKILTSTINNGTEVWNGLESEEEILQRCRDFDDLAMALNSGGYKTQYELRSEGKTKSNRIGYLGLMTDEITVDIGRDGSLLFVDGRHRMCLAKVLDLELVPVVVLVRHKRWMEKRDAYYLKKSVNQSSHPDLKNL